MKNIALERIGEKIMRARKRAKMTREKLGRALNYTVFEIEEIEWGKRDIGLSKFAQLATILKIDTGEILDEIASVMANVRRYEIGRANAKKTANARIELEWDEKKGLYILTQIDGVDNYLCCSNTDIGWQNLIEALTTIFSDKKYKKCNICLKTSTMEDSAMKEIAKKLLLTVNF